MHLFVLQKEKSPPAVKKMKIPLTSYLSTKIIIFHFRKSQVHIFFCRSPSKSLKRNNKFNLNSKCFKKFEMEIFFFIFFCFSFFVFPDGSLKKSYYYCFSSIFYSICQCQLSTVEDEQNNKKILIFFRAKYVLLSADIYYIAKV